MTGRTGNSIEHPRSKLQGSPPGGVIPPSPKGRGIRVGVALSVAALACGNPPVVPSADHTNDLPQGVITGSVIFSGTSRGNVILLLFNAQNPPPPAGAGRPLDFAVIDSSVMFGGGTGSGPFSAPYTLGPVPAGQTYLVAAFLDADLRPASHAPDFVPWYSVTDEPGAGDVLGGYVDTSNGTLLPVVVPESGGAGQAATQVSVILAESTATTVPVDRPSFNVTGGNTLSGNPTLFSLNAYPFHLDPVFAGGPFLLRFVDDNHDGIPDVGPDGVTPLFWPKVLVRKLDKRDPTGLHDENDLDADGIVDAADPQAVYYTGQYAKPDPDPSLPGAIILAAGVAPTPAEVAQLYNPATGKPDVNLYVPLPQLTLAIEQVALDIKVPTQPTPLVQVPSGSYAITVEQFTGQTWRLPNEMAPCPLSQGCPSLVPSDPTQTQGFVLSVP